MVRVGVGVVGESESGWCVVFMIFIESWAPGKKHRKSV